ncbi:DUF4190 domain-containing protein [Streptomyces sp. HUAS MG91]|uniref:DUF4190 domain-containing protein n=1 Tax=Streptomyces tabacisoli TaxID=3156398 RepID=A0AAU8IZ60_9ACTN
MSGGSTPQEHDPWAPPQAVPLAKASDTMPDTTPDLHDRQTVTSMPLAPGPQAAPPQTPPPPPAPGPQAPPHGHGPVPPPPISPDGPGQQVYGAQQAGPQYGYPGPQYGYPGPQHGYPAPQHPAPYGGAQNYAYWPGAVQAQPSNGLGVAGMVLGIISDVLFLMWPIAIICGVLGIIFGAMGRGKAKRGEATNPGQALTGIICGAAGVALAVGFIVLVVATF